MPKSSSIQLNEEAFSKDGTTWEADSTQTFTRIEEATVGRIGITEWIAPARYIKAFATINWQRLL